MSISRIKNDLFSKIREFSQDLRENDVHLYHHRKITNVFLR